MAKTPAPEKPQASNLSTEEMRRGVARLQKRLDAVTAFDPNTLDHSDPRSTVRPLETSIAAALTETFGTNSIEFNRYRMAATFDWPITLGSPVHHSVKVDHVKKDKQRSIQLLTAAIELLNERLEDAPPGVPSSPTEQRASDRIFIVHGHDNEPKEAVARFLSSLGYQPVILHEQANKGRTIIQKFRDEASDVGFAIILMTPDDKMPDGTSRARQNVILELGFFLGALGPDRVAALVKGQVERPSDFDGVIYIQFDPGWKAGLAKEMQASGYSIDWNIVMR